MVELKIAAMSEIEKSTLEVIAWRVKTGSKPNQRDDPYKVGLVLEGGGTRGVRGAGMGIGLQAIGALEAVDVVDAVSAGGPTAAFGAGRQGPLGTSIYYEEMQNGFLDFKRYLKGEPVIDIPFLAYDVFVNKKRLDWEAVVASPIPIHLFVTSAQDVGLVDISQFNSQQDVLDALHWTCRIPIAAGLPVRVGDSYLTDGTIVVNGVPIQSAIDQGCTHILSLQNRNAGTFKARYSPQDLMIYFHLKKNGYHKLAEASWYEAINYNNQLRRIDSLAADPFSQPRVEVFQLPGNHRRISNIEVRSNILRQEAIAGFNLTLKKFAPFDLPVDPNVFIK